VTFAELKTELAARGFDYLSDTRQGYFINRAYQEMCAENDWPFLEDSTTGTAPLTIADMRTVESVVNSTQSYRLSPLDPRNIMEEDDDLTTTGTPVYYYLSATTTLKVYPANTADTLSVRYYHVPPDLSDDADTPEVPAAWRHLIVDGAAAYAYFDSDNPEMGREMLSLWAEGKARMADALLVQQHDQPDDMVLSVVDHQDA